MPLTWILLLLVAALLGWLASVLLRADTAGQVLGLVGLGLTGAFLGALLITPVLAGPVERSGFSLPGLLLSLLGPLLLLGAAVLVRRLRPAAGVSGGGAGSGGKRTGSAPRR